MLKTILNFIDISTAHPKPLIFPWMEFRNLEVFVVVIKEVIDCIVQSQKQTMTSRWITIPKVMQKRIAMIFEAVAFK